MHAALALHLADFGFDLTAITVTVPVGAAYLSLAKSDAWHDGNTDLDHDHGVLVGLAPVPKPQTWAMWLARLSVLGGLTRSSYHCGGVLALDGGP